MWVSCVLAKEDCCNWVLSTDDIRWMPCERSELSHYTCTNIHEQRQGHAKHDQVSRRQQQRRVKVQRGNAMWHSRKEEPYRLFFPLTFVWGKDFTMWEIWKKNWNCSWWFVSFYRILFHTSTLLHFISFSDRYSDWLLCKLRLLKEAYNQFVKPMSHKMWQN